MSEVREIDFKRALAAVTIASGGTIIIHDHHLCRVGCSACMIIERDDAAGIWLVRVTEDYLAFRDFVVGIRTELRSQGGLTEEEAENYGNDDDWRGYFEDGYSPKEAVAEDMTYWGE